MEKIIIYDFGANRGQNLKYFLSKADIVIAVEPISELCEKIEMNFDREIKEGKLFVENLAIVDNENISFIDFYKNRKSWLSSLKNDHTLNTEKIKVKSSTPTVLFEKYGPPFYVKLDIENYDLNILKFLKEKNINPKFLSFEAQNQETYNYFKNNFSYKYFNFVLGNRLLEDYDQKFEFHSSGPIFGDFKFKWINESFLTFCLKIHNYGWIDIHCTNENVELINYLGKMRTVVYFINDKFKKLFSKNLNRLKGKMRKILSKVIV